MSAQMHEVMLVIDYFKLQSTSEHDNSTVLAHLLLFIHSAMYAVKPTPNVTRRQFGPALTGPVVVGVNEMISIWCSALFMFQGSEGIAGSFLVIQ